MAILTRAQLQKTVDAYKKHGSQRAAADALGLSQSAFNFRLTKAAAAGLDAALPPKPVAAPTVIVPDRSVVALRDRLKATEKALREAHRQANESDVIADLVGVVAAAPRDIPEWVTKPRDCVRGKPAFEVPVTIWCDWHLGERVEPAEVNGFNAYNMEVAEERIERLVTTTIKLATRNHNASYPGAVVNLGGDFVSGGLHPELKATDDEEVIPASIRAIDLIAGGLSRMADTFGQLYVPAVCGNHGRATAKPEFKRYYRKNFDWLIVRMLQKHFENDKRIRFDVRPSNDVFYRVYGERYLLQHGDMLGVKGGDGIIGAIGPIMRGETKKAGQSSILGLPFDKLLIGHWHQRLWLPRVTCGNTIKGFDEYAKNQLGAKPDRPSQSLWFAHPSHGQTAHWDVYVDEKPEPATEWVSWRNATDAAHEQ